MFIGHVPAGYLCTRAVWSACDRIGHARPSWKPFLIAGLVASILPDFDLLYFYLLDDGLHPHHTYWTHLPVYWALIGTVFFVLAVALRWKRFIPYLAVVEINLMLHLCLDTIVGKISWLYPLSWHQFFLFAIPRVHEWWFWDFLFHWTFLFEILLWVTAVHVYARSHDAGRASENCLENYGVLEADSNRALQMFTRLRRFAIQRAKRLVQTPG